MQKPCLAAEKDIMYGPMVYAYIDTELRHLDDNNRKNNTAVWNSSCYLRVVARFGDVTGSRIPSSCMGFPLPLFLMERGQEYSYYGP